MAKKRATKKKRKAVVKRNPPKGWIAARAVKIVRRGGKTQVWIRKAGKGK
jgi:hypothetical protein